ncbi:unnamed protein product [Chironomus riparius]|uniref:Uncharacterized protein n=1 Tax=Chironomus riparius TaxID=315576 RepID=A0A9N9WUX1_9DIPT|nr:unnamed protein product [Chironomus riparius]
MSYINEKFEWKNFKFNFTDFYQSLRLNKSFVYPTWPTFLDIPNVVPFPTYSPTTARTFTRLYHPRKRMNIPVMILCFLTIVFIYWNLCKLRNKKHQYVDIETGTNHHQQTQERSTTETSRHADVVPTAPPVESLHPQSLQPEVYLQIDVSNNENPPSYDEAMKMIEKQKQRLEGSIINDVSNSVNTISSERPVNSIHRLEDTYL